MFKTILKMGALSATLTLLSACGASDFLRCSGFGLGEKAFDRPSCDSFTGGGTYELSGFKEQAIGRPIVNETGTATYDGIFGLYGSDTRTGGVRLTVNFDEKKITNNNNIHRTSVTINGKFTERGVLTGKFNMANDGIASADINGMVGGDGVWATFDNRSETADGYLGGFRATRLPEVHSQPAGCSYCASLSPEDIVKLNGYSARIDPNLIEEKRLAIEEIRLINAALLAEQARWDEAVLPRVTYKPAPVAVRTAAINVTRIEDDDRVVNMFTFDPIKASDTFSLEIGVEDIITVNDVDYAFIDELLVDPRGASPAGHIMESAYAWYNNEFDRTFTKNQAIIFSSEGRNNADIRQVINGAHPTVQGDYFEYRTKLDDFGLHENENDRHSYTTGFATVGIQTDAAAVQSQTAVVTYRGQGRLHSYKTLREYNHTFFQDATLAMTMSVDFDANTIQGTGRRKTKDQYAFLEDNVIFNSAPIVDNGFSGTFTLNSRMREWYHLTDNPTGQYDGNFFGPNADDLAGTMRFEGASRQYDYDYSNGTLIPNDFDVIGVGGFRADRQ